MRDRRTWSKHLEVFTSQALMDLLSKAYLPITSLPRRQDHLSIIKSIHEQTPALAEGLGSRMACAWSGGLARRMHPAHTSSYRTACHCSPAASSLRGIRCQVKGQTRGPTLRLRPSKVGPAPCHVRRWPNRSMTWTRRSEGAGPR